MIQDIINLILIGEFETALKKEKEYSKNISRELFEKAYDLESIAIYTYYNYKISKQENSADHYQASLILSQILNTINGAYDMSFYHAKEAIRLDPENLEYKEYILIFSNYPDLTMEININDFKSYAFDLLDSNPKNIAATCFLQSIEVFK